MVETGSGEERMEQLDSILPKYSLSFVLGALMRSEDDNLVLQLPHANAMRRARLIWRYFAGGFISSFII
jgi:hypothetical protein